MEEIGNRINPIAHKMTQHRVPVLCCFIYDCFLSIPYICSPHQFLLQVLYERMLTEADDELFVVGLAHGYSGCLVATLVASVNGDEEIVAAAVYLDAYLCAVVYHQWAGAQAVWRDGGEHEHVGVGRDDRASYAERIAGRARGGGNDEAVGLVGDTVGAVERYLYGHH